MRLLVRNQTPEEAAALAAERGMNLGQYLRAGGAPTLLARAELAALAGVPSLGSLPAPDHQEEPMERLTHRTAERIDELEDKVARELTFNELVALAGLRLEFRSEAQPAVDADEARDLALVRTHLEDALTRYNSACYRRAGTWKRADPDRLS